MGMDARVYIGVFISVPAIQVPISPETRKCSAKCPGELPAEAKFCSSCGSPTVIARAARYGEGAMSLCQLPDELSRLLYELPYSSGIGNDSSIFIPDQKNWGRTLNVEEGDAISLGAVESAKEIASFTEKHAAVLKYIRDTVGVKPTVHWGAVTYAS